MNKTLRICGVAAILFFPLGFTVGWSVGVVLSACLTATALVLVRDGLKPSSRLAGVITIAWLYWGLSYLSNLIEALYFGIIPFAGAGKSAIFALGMALAAAALLEWMTSIRENGEESLSAVASGVVWRIPLLCVTFFLVYITAGIAIQPWIMSFYAHRQLPSLQQLFVLQLCRGLLDLACVYPCFLQWVASRRRAVWLSAYVFTVLCGWAPLLLPNRFMPSPIRLAHAFEMGASGIVFGAITALLLLKQSASPKRIHEPPPIC